MKIDVFKAKGLQNSFRLGNRNLDLWAKNIVYYFADEEANFQIAKFDYSAQPKALFLAGG